ncbi:hypothetical protein SC1083_0295 [Aggregatibacter actinomycetemcomitans serotype e str. SC1083]|uniref:Uncharacterized protein n=1 Tax=Aggregatibacter actinomycetemcomitans serotype e str. SC1083 TaxID=907488 RepID=G4A656_AGGAC|nr:hypothetical protein SC1083_0295 [Aggregatibacter actinomycetemcomitans serotype e str. SC1083]
MKLSLLKLPLVYHSSRKATNIPQGFSREFANAHNRFRNWQAFPPVA